MGDEKDRFGEKLRDAEKGREDQYFAERDRELLRRAKTASSSQNDAHLKDAPRMRCPKCGERLTTIRHLDVTIDECPACRGMWLDKGELEQIARREITGWVARYLGRAR